MARTNTVVTVISKISDRPTNPISALVVIYGVELGRKYDLVARRTVIGRSSKCDIQVDQESVSRSHAELVLDKEGAVRIADAGSTNGTWVNDELISAVVELRNGDLIKIGRTIFKFIAGGNIETAYHDEVYRLTTVDGLTQAFNRRYFEEALEREISRCRRYERELCLILIDIDRFKHINDTWGHLAGDHVLKHLASTVKANVRKEDVFARYGGEEFALLLPELELKSGLATAEKLRKLVASERFHFDNQDIPVTISLGISSLDGEGRKGNELLRMADDKLYAAKNSGRNRVCA